MHVFDLNDTAADDVTVGYRRSVALLGNVSVARITGEAGETTQPHSHDTEELVLVLEGAWRFTVDGSEVTLRGGQGLLIPPGVEHAAVMLEPTVALDVCSGPRRDWLSGEDRHLHVNVDEFLWAV
jgi:quercetin dioxygenase-like cupin family protein